MDLIWDGIREAARLWWSGDGEIIEITLRTLAISAAATALALAIGIPLGAVLALRRFLGRGLIVAAVNTGMGMPPVVVGLLVALILWRTGPLGDLNLIYTPTAMVVAQFLLSLPLVVGFSLASIQSVNPRLIGQMWAMGANRWQVLWLLIRETRLGLLAAVMAGFGAAISEVGASMQVGGNLAGETRVLTTATVLETGRGNFEVAIALSLVLVVLAFIVNLVLTAVQQRRFVT
ncbi:MAG: ABC transporter permease [Chloroflexi bacterium]|nr:ABC transporter permease [Chloroflexota bacterium]MCY3696166.1 ABC transporter permease [Chloroflexota bacterium]MXX32445.1 ABC transporter permease subunit [Chloroflexota bacterium]MXX79849.1 ABC transporter permease subunit [Chloroflexota bacterium]MYB23481.1 ABC transporter permease subunit [Chloroflexota bacterium]